MKDVAKYIKQTDSHPHIVTGHFAIVMHGYDNKKPGSDLDVWRDPFVEITYNNAYSNIANPKGWQGKFFTGTNRRGIVDRMRAYSDPKNGLGQFKQPLLLGEWGGHHAKNRHDHLITELHLGLWANFMTNMAGNTGYWWWNLIDHENIYHYFTPVVNFSKGEDRRGKNYVHEETKIIFKGGSNGRRALTLSNENELFA